MRWLVLLMTMLTAPAWAETIRIPGPDGILLNAELYPAQGKVRGASVVALHGCGGPYPSRDYDWARRLSSLGHTVLLPDSFGSRGLGSQCSVLKRSVTPSGLRRQDAFAALEWLAARPDTPKGGIVLMGWSDGGTTVLTAGRERPDTPPGLIRGLVAFYPGCKTTSEISGWTPVAPLMLLVGEADDWTPAPPCKILAEKVGAKMTLVTYPDAFHDFDAPNAKLKENVGLATPAGGKAHTGTNPMARDDAIRRVPTFIAGLPPLP